MHAADDIVGRRGQGAHLALLHFPVHPVQPQPERLVAAGPFDVVGDADGFECLGGVVVHLGGAGEEGADQAPRVGTGGGEQSFRAITKAAGIGEDWTPREMRHTFVSIMSDNDVPIETIADLVGHKGTSVTERVYRHQLKPVITKGATTMNTLFNQTKETKSA